MELKKKLALIEEAMDTNEGELTAEIKELSTVSDILAYMQ